MKGKTIPQIGVIDIAIMDEDLPRLLQFERGDLDVIVLRGEVASRLLSDGKLKPEYAARGYVRHVFPEPFTFSSISTWPTRWSAAWTRSTSRCGGRWRTRSTRRRWYASSMRVRRSPASQFIPPGVGGHDPSLPRQASLRSGGGECAARPRSATRTRDAEGFRKTPDGKPLTNMTLRLRSGGMREVQTLWKKNMEAIGLRTDFHVTPFQDAIKELERGQFQTYFGGFGGSPAGYNVLSSLRQAPQRVNVTQFKNARFRSRAEDSCAARRARRRLPRRAG